MSAKFVGRIAAFTVNTRRSFPAARHVAVSGGQSR